MSALGEERVIVSVRVACELARVFHHGGLFHWLSPLQQKIDSENGGAAGH
jgi:hypothetical protein